MRFPMCGEFHKEERNAFLTSPFIPFTYTRGHLDRVVLLDLTLVFSTFKACRSTEAVLLCIQENTEGVGGALGVLVPNWMLYSSGPQTFLRDKPF